jgi:hypothetical protein
MQLQARQAKSESFEYLDPQAELGKEPRPYTARLSLDKRPLVIGLLSNLFADASVFLQDLCEPLAEFLPGVEFRFYDKVTVQRMSFPVSEETRNRILDECDAVICGYGHCGSCTSGTTQDNLAFAALSFPTVALVTEKFRDEALFLARAGGIPDIPFVFLPHPVAGRPEVFHKALARAIAPAILEALAQGTVKDMSRCNVKGHA